MSSGTHIRAPSRPPRFVAMIHRARLRRIGTLAAAVLTLLTAVVPVRVAGGVVLCVASSHVAIEQSHAAATCVEATPTASDAVDVDADDVCFDLSLPAPEAMKHGNERTIPSMPFATPLGVAPLAPPSPFLSAPSASIESHRLAAGDMRLTTRVFRI